MTDMTPGTMSLKSLEGDSDRLRIVMHSSVQTAIDELLSIAILMSRVLHLAAWAREYPAATNQLLTVVARDPKLAIAFTPIVLAWIPMLGTKACELDIVDEVLVSAFPVLQGAWRDAAAERATVHEKYHLVKGVDYEVVGKPDPAWLWPIGKPLPPADQVDGVQARLNSLGYGAGPITGEWSPETHRALARWQIHAGIEPTGEIDDRTVVRLEIDTEP